MCESLPHFAVGKVVKGFGRGSKTLGTPTANLDQQVVNSLPVNFRTGIYFGWAKIDNGPVYEMVTCIGWNPFFKNELKSMETHVLHDFQEDFYGATLKICLVGYIRDEMNFTSIDELKAAIQNDIEVAKQKLQEPSNQKYRSDPFFTQICESSNGVLSAVE